MSPLRSFLTLLCLLVYALAMPLADDDDDDPCASVTQTPLQHLVVSAVHVSDSPPASILAPYQHPPTPHPSPLQHPHATLPVSRQSHSPALLGAVVAGVIALVAITFTARYVARRRHIAADPFKDPPKPRFAAPWLRRSTTSKKRLSDESWVSPPLPSLGSPGSPLSHDLELRRYAYTQRKLVPVTSPVPTPTNIKFGRGFELVNDDSGSAIPVPPVRVPSPVYISPFSPPLSLSSSSLSPTPSTDPLSSPSSNTACFSRLLSSTFRDSRVVTSYKRPSTAHLIQTARSYAYAYRPSSTTTTSLYAPPNPSARLSGTRSRISFYSSPTDDARAGWRRVRDTFSTVTTTDTVYAVPHLHHAVSEVQPSISPFADPGTAGDGTQHPTASVCGLGLVESTHTAGLGTSLGLKVRLSDASEHAHYRLREREREHERKREREHVERLSTDSQASEETATSVETGTSVHQQSRSLGTREAREEFKLRDSESVLREIGW